MKFIILIFLCVEEKKMSIPEMDLKLSEEWIYAEKLSKLKTDGIEITGLPGFEQLIMELLIPENGGLNHKMHCVYYTVPYKEKISVFKVQSISSIDACPETSEKGSTLVYVQGINNLKITFVNFKLIMDFKSKKEQKKIEISMPNIEVGLEHSKYHALKEKRLMSGLRYLRLDDNSFDYSTNRYLGNHSDRFSKGSAIRCEQVSSDCKTLGENRCSECRYGWYEVVDFQCPQGGSKFCGQNHCGEKNEPACPRGTKVIESNETGICQSDLEPVVNADKILVCQ
jgi:hypothetical protein